MIFIQEQPEPLRFKKDVREPGRRFLTGNRTPTAGQWNGHWYWRRVLGELHAAYRGVCAYTCHWIAYDTGSETVDHFVPKSLEPTLAYEWNNFRLACGRMNGRKGNHQDVLDPFTLRRHVFELGFPSLLIRPSRKHSADLVAKAEGTIERLGLNDELCVTARWGYVKAYCASHITLQFVADHAPFIYEEIVRQKLEEKIRMIMSM